MIQKIWHKLKFGFILLVEWIKYQICWVIASVLKRCSKEYRDLWIVSERGREARDNGYWFFKYLREKHPEINACYVISEDSPDKEKVESLGKTVRYRSLEHYLKCAASEVKVSTHIVGYTPDITLYYMLEKIRLLKGVKIFLQHGIIKDDMLWYHYPNVRTDLFVCSSERETAFIQQKYGYPPNTVKKLGLCRFDALQEPCDRKNQILLMPTWRKYAVENKTRAEFEKSVYYKKYQSLLNNQELIALLDKYQLELIFYPHFEVQKYLDSFSSVSKRIIPGYFSEYDVQQLLKESKVLITDFSSVFFDFAYMKKPEIFYQFDREEYRRTQYGEGYFSYERDGFGPIAETEKELISCLKTVIERDFQVAELYMARISNFFGKMDRENCRRNYETVCEILRQRGKK